MNIIQAICLGLGVIGVILALLKGPKYENLLEQYFIFCVIPYVVVISFGYLVLKYYE